MLKAPDTSSVTSVPEPAGIVLPVSEKPSTVELDELIVKPLAVASPPPAYTILPLSILNWKPAISTLEL